MHSPRLSVSAVAFLAVLFNCGAARATTRRVPGDHKTIQAAIDAAVPGDLVLVDPGVYRERVRLRAGLHVRSAGDDAKGQNGLRRAEETIIDGAFDGASGPGVSMAEDSVLDGFTVTGVGKYDEALWKKHHATQGEEQDHEHIGAPGVAGVSVDGIECCTVRNNVVRHIGYTGIAVFGAEGKRVSPHISHNVVYRNMGGGIGSMKGSTAIIERNTCFENLYAGIGQNDASPLILDNVCYANVRAGIGVSEGSSPIIRGNRCFRNRRAGIGIRTGAETRPVVDGNECYENDMAGIGVREGASPVIRGNRCYKNKLAGIGARDGARPIIVENESRENLTAGIGVRGKESVAVLVGNRCLENRLVAIGLPDGATGLLHRNELVRTGGGAPPLVAVKGGARALVSENSIRGGGVAGVLVQGDVRVVANRFDGKGPGQGSAIWVWKGSQVNVSGNLVRGYRNLVNASEARVVVTDNHAREFQGASIVVRKPSAPACVFGNTAASDRAADRVADVEGAESVSRANVLEKPKSAGGDGESGED